MQYSDGNFYPAAIYLGGSDETVVHAIDSQVASLITEAEVSGNGGTNNSGGGIVQVTQGVSGVTACALGSLNVTLVPARAVSAGAYWEIAGDNTVRYSGQSALGLAPGPYTVQFFPGGDAYAAPQATQVNVVAGGNTSVIAHYLPNPPAITSGTTTTAIEGQAFQYQIVASPAVTSYSIVSGTLPSGLTLNGTTGLISSAGSVRFSGKLGDGLPITLSGSLGSNGVWPFLFSKPAGKTSGSELIFGSVAFPPGADGMAGTLDWYRSANPNDPVYRNGFSTTIPFLAGRYTPPAVSSSSADVTFSGANLTAPLIEPVSLNSKDQVTTTGATPFTLKFTAATGLFTGAFPDNGTSRAFTGAVLKSGSTGMGLFQEPSGETGSVFLQW